MEIFVEAMEAGCKNHGMNGCRNDGFFGRFQQLGNSGDEFFVVAKYRVASSHVCDCVFARNGFRRMVGKRVAGNPPVDFFQKILVEWMLRVLHHVLEGFEVVKHFESLEECLSGRNHPQTFLLQFPGIIYGE